MKCRCGITFWHQEWAVFAAEAGYSPTTILAKFHSLDCISREVHAASMLDAAIIFAEDIELPFGEEINTVVTLGESGWGKWRFSLLAEKAGEPGWMLEDHYER